MFAAYSEPRDRPGAQENSGRSVDQQNSDRRVDPPEISNVESSYHSFPTETPKRNSLNEERIKMLRKKRRALQKLERQVKEFKEDLTYQPVRQEDSSDDSDDYAFTIRNKSERVCIATPNVTAIHKKHASFAKHTSSRKRKVSSSSSSSSDSGSSSSSSSTDSTSSADSRRHSRKRKHRKKRSKKNRRRSESPSTSRRSLIDPILYEGSERGSKARFKPKTENMIKFKNLDGDYDYLTNRRESEKLSINRIMFYSYHPDHDSYVYQYKAKVINVLWCPTKVLQSADGSKVHRWIFDSRPNHLKSKRIYEVKFNPAKYENNFRILPLEGDFIPLATKVSNYKHPWEIREEAQRKQMDEEIISKMRIEAHNEGKAVDDEILLIKKKIREEPKVADHYIHFVNCEEQVFERNRSEGRQTNDRTGLNERKLAILDEGIKHCPQNAKLLLEKINILKEYKPDEALSLWQKALHSFPNDLQLREAYLDFIQYDSQMYSSEKMKSAFKNCRLVLEGLLSGTFVSHETLPGTREFLLKIWIREICWLFEQGYVALAIASVQASIEISYFAPQSCKEVSQRKTLFRGFWDSGAPRIGDLFYQGGFRQYSANQRGATGLYKKLEKDEISKEYEASKNICNVLKHTTSNAQGFVKIEQEHGNVLCRPLRFTKESWSDASQEFQDHIFDRDYYGYEQLHLLVLKDEEVFEVFSALGIETASRTLCESWSCAAYKLGINLVDDNIPSNAFLIIVRMFWQYLTTQKELSKELYMLPYAFIASAQRLYNNKKIINKMVFNFLKDCTDKNSASDNGHPFIEGLTSNHYILFRYLTLKKMLEKNILAKASTLIIAAVDNMCTSNGKEISPNLQDRLLLAHVNLAAEILDATTLLDHLANWLGKWKRKQITDIAEKNIFIKQILEETIMKSPDCEISTDLAEANDLFPSTSASACSLLIHFYRCLKAGHRGAVDTSMIIAFYNGYKDAFCNNYTSSKEFHYSFILYLKQEWYVYHQKKDFFVTELDSHTAMFPDDYRVIQIAIEYMKSRASTVLPTLRNEGRNPLSNCFKGPLASMYQTLVKIALADKNSKNANTSNMINTILVKTLSKAAELNRSPYLWKAALAKSTNDGILQTYIKASAQCRWSKELHMERILRSCTERVLSESYSLMNEANVKLYISPDDVETYEQILHMRSQ